ncbi:RNA 2',3'-cyclic phosphodiesterase [Halalkalibacter alkalisediminis]|uniref:RNA 2',3'-cyclic phosphodiesterase n=1 Tax=Halalkalibacter alkalisediminis TaxID=935616 RepID=A0ABV6NMP0_9BACI|nr:RNA 2',3'-cyclic phosphodiesterase [Halalkalibacter alkalisediminis]
MQSHYFLAVPLPSEIKKEIKRTFENEALPFKRWVHEEDYHVTLVFLGACTLEQLEHIQKECAVRLAKVKSFPLDLASVGTFGKKDKPRIFWLGLEEQPLLHDVRKEVSAICEEAGFKLEKRPFSPHVTVARKWVGDGPYREELVKDLHFNKQWTVDKVVLYKSVLTEEPKYKEVAVFTLNEVER